MIISVNGCEDDDLPLSYRFSYFMKGKLYKNGIKLSLEGLYLDHFTDYSSINTIDTILLASFKKIINEVNDTA
jgi:hypothetical protein